MFCESITFAEILDIVKKNKDNASPGDDDINTKV